MHSPELAQQLLALRAALGIAVGRCPLAEPNANDCAIPADPSRFPLNSSILNYVFFPISQLIQAVPRGPADLPDRIRLEAFGCLELLCREWWRRWQSISSAPLFSQSSPAGSEEALQMWKQLLILGAIALGDPLKVDGLAAPKQSPETTLAILQFLYTLLVPRKECDIICNQKQAGIRAQSSTQESEWDGESELPIFDDAGEDNSDRQNPTSAPSAKPQRVLYPTATHLQQTLHSSMRSPLLHALGSSLDVVVSASTHSSTLVLRSTALSVVRIIVTHWLPGGSTDRVLIGSRTARVMPGVVSKIVRLLNSAGGETSSGGHLNPVDVHGELVARSLMLLKDVVVSSLNDHVTNSARSKCNKTISSEGTTLTLSDLFDGLNIGKSKPKLFSPPSDIDTDTENVSIRTTFRNLNIAFLNLQQSTDHSSGIASHTNSMARYALVSLATELLEECADGITWYDETVRDPETNPRLSSILWHWLWDLAPHNEGCPSLSGVERSAREAAQHLLRSRHYYAALMRYHSSQALSQIPRALVEHQSNQATMYARRVAAISIAAMSLLEDNASIPLPTIKIENTERWGLKLIESVQLSSRPTSLPREPTESPNDSILAPGLANVDNETACQISSMLRCLGSLLGALLVVAAARKYKLESHLGSTSNPDHAMQSVGIHDLTPVTYFMDQSRFYRALSMSAKCSSKVAATSLMKAVTSLFITRELFLGLCESLDESKLSLQPGKAGRRLRKHATNLANDIIKDILQDWEAETTTAHGTSHNTAVNRRTRLDNQLRHELAAQETDLDQPSVEHVKSFPLTTCIDEHERPRHFGPALDLSFLKAATISTEGSVSKARGQVANQQFLNQYTTQIQLFRALQLDLLALAARLRGPAFQPHLVTTLYPILSALTHPSMIIADAASSAVQTISYSTGYADTLSLVRENIDYILGEASWRLVVGLEKELELAAVTLGCYSEQTNFDVTLSSSLTSSDGSSNQALTCSLLSAKTTPRVLIKVMRLLGPESLHLIEDSVDEILDALDRFHAFEDVASSLLGVLERLLDTMSMDANCSGFNSETEQGRRHARPDPLKDAAGICTWIKSRKQSKDPQSADVDLSSAFDSVESQAHQEEETVTSAEKTSPASRSQRLLVTILNKALPFLSHQAPCLRTLVLRLLTSGTQLLAPGSFSQHGQQAKEKWCRREEELLPLINRAWPLLMARLGWDVTKPLPISYVGVDVTEDAIVVHLEAVRLLEALGRHVPEFLAKRITQEAWPRLKLLLDYRGHNESIKGSQQKPREKPSIFRLNGTIDLLPGSGHESGEKFYDLVRSFEPLSPHSPTYGLLLATIRALTPLLEHEGPAFPQKELWQLTTHRLFLGALNMRQSIELRRAAVCMLKATNLCDGGGTIWCALGCFGQASRSNRKGVDETRMDSELALKQSVSEIFALN